MGSGRGSGAGSEADSVREEDTGFWDLVYILYPDFAEAIGAGPLRELVPHWSLLEKTLLVSFFSFSHQTLLLIPILLATLCASGRTVWLCFDLLAGTSFGT